MARREGNAEVGAGVAAFDPNKMTIDLDELERLMRTSGRTMDVDLQFKLIALARKGQELEAEVARLQRFDATASDYVESVEKRAEVYERALRFYADCKAYELRHDGGPKFHIPIVKDCGDKAREALEKGAK